MTKAARHTPALSERDLKILSYVQAHILQRGVSPSHREIQRALKIPHLLSVQRSLHKLQLAGKVAKQKSTGKVWVKERREEHMVALLGDVAAGRPIEAIENPQNIEIPSWMMKPGAEYFALRVRGNSMIEDGILNEDLVLIRKQETAKNGDTVVALVNNEATLKRFERKGGKILLHPANSEMKPFEVSGADFRIAGLYAGVIRSTE